MRIRIRNTSFTKSRIRIKNSRSRSRPKTGRLRNPVFSNCKLFSLPTCIYFCLLYPYIQYYCRLGEDKPELIEGVVGRFGRRLALNLYRLVQQTEARGGMVINVSSGTYRTSILKTSHTFLSSSLTFRTKMITSEFESIPRTGYYMF